MDGTVLRILMSVRRFVAPVIVLALVVPSVLGVLPASAAASLERDIAMSLCRGGEEGGAPVLPAHANHEQCCILCPVAGSSPALISEAPALSAPDFDSVSLLAATVAPSRHSAHLSGVSARGPPLT